MRTCALGSWLWIETTSCMLANPSRLGCEQDPRSAVGWVALAQSYAERRRDDAMPAARGAEQFGGDAPAIESLALFYAGTGDAARAAGWERRFAASPGAARMEPRNAAALSLDAGEPEMAIQWARTALDRAG